MDMEDDESIVEYVGDEPVSPEVNFEFVVDVLPDDNVVTSFRINEDPLNLHENFTTSPSLLTVSQATPLTPVSQTTSLPPEPQTTPTPPLSLPSLSPSLLLTPETPPSLVLPTSLESISISGSGNSSTDHENENVTNVQTLPVLSNPQNISSKITVPSHNTVIKIIPKTSGAHLLAVNSENFDQTSQMKAILGNTTRNANSNIIIQKADNTDIVQILQQLQQKRQQQSTAEAATVATTIIVTTTSTTPKTVVAAITTTTATTTTNLIDKHSLMNVKSNVAQFGGRTTLGNEGISGNTISSNVVNKTVTMQIVRAPHGTVVPIKNPTAGKTSNLPNTLVGRKIITTSYGSPVIIRKPIIAIAPTATSNSSTSRSEVSPLRSPQSTSDINGKPILLKMPNVTGATATNKMKTIVVKSTIGKQFVVSTQNFVKLQPKVIYTTASNISQSGCVAVTSSITTPALVTTTTSGSSGSTNDPLHTIQVSKKSGVKYVKIMPNLKLNVTTTSTATATTYSIHTTNKFPSSSDADKTSGQSPSIEKSNVKILNAVTIQPPFQARKLMVQRPTSIGGKLIVTAQSSSNLNDNHKDNKDTSETTMVPSTQHQQQEQQKSVLANGPTLKLLNGKISCIKSFSDTGYDNKIKTFTILKKQKLEDNAGSGSDNGADVNSPSCKKVLQSAPGNRIIVLSKPMQKSLGSTSEQHNKTTVDTLNTTTSTTSNKPLYSILKPTAQLSLPSFSILKINNTNNDNKNNNNGNINEDSSNIINKNNNNDNINKEVRMANVADNKLTKTVVLTDEHIQKLHQLQLNKKSSISTTNLEKSSNEVFKPLQIKKEPIEVTNAEKVDASEAVEEEAPATETDRTTIKSDTKIKTKPNNLKQLSILSDPVNGGLFNKTFGISTNDRNNKIANEGEDAAMVGAIRRKPCNCSKSQCLKLYCDCFANGEFCQNCTCKDCLNSLKHDHERQRAIQTCLGRNPSAFKPKIVTSKDQIDMRLHHKGCNCKRSGCLKNYCECYEAKIPCSSNCKCVGCRNIEDRPDLDMDPIVSRDRLSMGDDEIKLQRRSPYRRNYIKTPSNMKRTTNGFDNMRKKALKNTLSIDENSNTDVEIKSSVTDTQKSNFITQEVIDATVQCMIVQADECEKSGLPLHQTERMIMEEMGRCLVEIIDFSIRNNDINNHFN